MELGMGNVAALEPMIAQALKEGMQPIMLLRSAQRHFQRLYAVKEASLGGKTLEQAVAALKPPLFFRAVQPFTRQAQEWSMGALVAALEALGAAELACKQSGAAPALLVSRAFMKAASVKRSKAGAH
jgi:DNA polymerase III subunit delta